MTRHRERRALDQLLYHDGEVRKPRQRQQGLARRGALRSAMGFAEAGYQDLEQAVKDRKSFSGKSGYWLQAQRAEAKRVYARDVVLNSPTQMKTLRQLMRSCIADFDGALVALARTAPENDDAKAWILAHRGAARTNLFWAATGAGESKKSRDRLFKEADRDFRDALACRDQYPWCLLFQAMLYTLRGEVHDFEDARLRLALAASSSADVQMWVKRSLALLRSYQVTALPTAEAVRAAQDAIQFGIEDIGTDREEFHSAYVVASCLAWLRDNTPGGKEQYGEHVAAAVANARVRARNAISKATATLAGLALIEGDKEVARTTFDKLKDCSDMEVATIFSRDPTFTKHKPYADLLKVVGKHLKA